MKANAQSPEDESDGGKFQRQENVFQAWVTDDFVAVEVTRLILKPCGWRHRTSKFHSESPHVDCYQRYGHVAVEVTRLIVNHGTEQD